MRCGNCEKTDGLCYTSNPPQVKCTITGEFHTFEHECNVISVAEIIRSKYIVGCMVCDDTIRIVDDPPIYHREICDKCKAAIMAMRNKLGLE